MLRNHYTERQRNSIYTLASGIGRPILLALKGSRRSLVASAFHPTTIPAKDAARGAQLYQPLQLLLAVLSRDNHSHAERFELL